MARLLNLTRKSAAALDVQPCASFLCRLRGLTFRKALPPNWGLLLIQSRENRLDAAIHMLWMWTDLAIIWIDDRWTVVDVRPAFRWRSFLAPRRPARYILETALENLENYRIGDQLEFIPGQSG